MARFNFVSYRPVKNTFLGRLSVRDPEWAESIGGNTTCSFKVTVPESPAQVELLRTATKPDEAAIYIRNTSGVGFRWGGVIVKRKWVPGNNELQITAVDWRSWLFNVFLPPRIDGTADITYTWSNDDQLQIARELVLFATDNGALDGRPFILTGVATSGQMRDLTVKGTDFKDVGSLIQTMSQRDNGFDWDIIFGQNPDGSPILRLGLWYPQRGTKVQGLIFRSNILKVADIEEDTSGRRTRVWAVGEGPNTDQLPWAEDSDAALQTGDALLKETAQKYSKVSRVSTLASHARALRYYLNEPVNLVTFDVSLNSPDIDTYEVGDRGRVVLRDRWQDIDESGVRIFERVIKRDQGIVTLTVNLNDKSAPEVDEGGSV
jgi:hypothetical protein